MPTENQSLEIAKLVIEAVRVLAWPVLIAILVILFFKPLREIAESFSLKFSEAHKVSIGSLSLEIEAKAREVGNPELGRQVGSLTPGAVEQLLRTPRSGDMILVSTSDFQQKREYGVPNQDALSSLKELEKKGFLKFRQPLEHFLAELRKLDRSDTNRGDSERTWHISPFIAESEGDKRIRDQGYSLTDKGRQAVDTIVKAVASQLTRGST